MTGYGKSVATYKEKKINVEIKSLNSKALDISTRVAPLYREKDIEIRHMLSQTLVRGKIDFCIWIEKESTADVTPINGELIDRYYKQIKEITQNSGIPEPQDWITTLLRMPDVMTKTEVEVLDEEEWNVAKDAITEAITKLQSSANRRAQRCKSSSARSLITLPLCCKALSLMRNNALRRYAPD